MELDLTANAPAADLIKDTNEATFMQDVIEASQEVPVIVDFWAPWCGPCKQLGPMLEAAVVKAGGKVRMVKVNADENQMISSQLRVQSLPTVFAFWQGQPVDAFQGAQPASEVDAFVNRCAELAGDGGLDDAINAAEELFEAGELDDAAQVFAAVMEEDPNNAKAFAGVARVHLARGDVDDAEAVLNGAPAEISDAQELETVRAQIELARQAEHAGPVTELRAKVAADENDHQSRFDLAIALNAAGEAEAAIDALLELFRRDRNWNDEAAKTQLFVLFDALPPQDPIVLNGRRRLSSLIFV